MVNELATNQAGLLEKVVIEGDLEKLSATERMEYYEKVCDSLGLNPLTRPFDYIKLSGKLTPLRQEGRHGATGEDAPRQH